MALHAFSSYVLGFGPIYLLAVERETRDNHRVAEAFLLMPRAKATYRAVTLRFSWSGLPEPGLVTGVDLLEAVRQWAFGEIDGELLAWCRQQTPAIPLPDRLTMSSAKPEDLLQTLWVTRVAENEIPTMYQQTQSDELSELLKRIIPLPHLSITPLNKDK